MINRVKAMALSKKSVIFCASIILFIVLVLEIAEADKFISYGAMYANGRKCRNRSGCIVRDTPANPYNRGCQASQRCRGGTE